MLLEDDLNNSTEDLQAALKRLKSYATSLGRVDGEDLVQEALARAIANGVPCEAIPWLRTVMKRLAIDRSRRAREVSSGGASDMDGLAVELEGPEELLLTGERREAVQQALAKLPPRYRDALLAYAVDGRASSVQKQFHLSAQATWTLLSRARTRLRDQLERQGFVPAFFASKFGPWFAAAATSAAAVFVFVGMAPYVRSPAQHSPKPPAIVRGAPVQAAAAAAVSSRPDPVHGRHATVHQSKSHTASVSSPARAVGAGTSCGGKRNTIEVSTEYKDDDMLPIPTGTHIMRDVTSMVPEDLRTVNVKDCPK